MSLKFTALIKLGWGTRSSLKSFKDLNFPCSLNPYCIIILPLADSIDVEEPKDDEYTWEPIKNKLRKQVKFLRENLFNLSV